MTRVFRLLLTVLALLASPVATSSTQSTDITDMWWIAAESGWGLNVILQNDIAFLTFFVYDETNVPYWVAASTNLQPSSGTDLVWTGDLYATTGPWFGGAFDPAAVTPRLVGTASFRLTAINRAILNYSVDGVAVIKIVERQTWKYENFTGDYNGGYSARATACTPASMNGIQENSGEILVTHVGSSFSAVFVGNPSCTFAGTYSQTGKLGDVVGNYNCADGTLGTFDFTEITGTISGFSAQMSGRDQFCQLSGTFGGIVRAQ